MPDEPIRPFTAALNVKASAEGPTRLQHPEGLTVSGLFVRKGVKAVEGQHNVEAFILKGQCSDVTLQKVDISDSDSIGFFCADAIIFSE